MNTEMFIASLQPRREPSTALKEVEEALKVVSSSNPTCRRILLGFKRLMETQPSEATEDDRKFSSDLLELSKRAQCVTPQPTVVDNPLANIVRTFL